MATLQGDIDFTGSIGNLSAYKMRGLDKTILRSKGGASKKKILKAPEFKLTRQNFTEFSGCAKMGGSIRRSMLVMAPVADYNYTPVLNALAKIIQGLDTKGMRGERAISLSSHRHLLNGFTLNRNTSLESIVKHPISCVIDRAAGKAIVQLPELTPGVNLVLNKKYPLFRFIVNLGCVGDRVFTSRGYMTEEKDTENESVYTDWHHAGEAFPGREISVQLKDTADLTDTISLILSVGIQMGIPITPSVVNPVKYAGSAKIMEVG
jgi:hypothetical protein